MGTPLPVPEVGSQWFQRPLGFHVFRVVKVGRGMVRVQRVGTNLTGRPYRAQSIRLATFWATYEKRDRP